MPAQRLHFRAHHIAQSRTRSAAPCGQRPQRSPDPGADARPDSAAAESLAASPVTLAEVLAGPARTGKLDRASAALAQPDINAISLDESAPVRLATLRAATSLKLPDCCVLLAAEQVGNATIATFDDRLATTARDRGIPVLGR